MKQIKIGTIEKLSPKLYKQCLAKKCSIPRALKKLKSVFGDEIDLGQSILYLNIGVSGYMDGRTFSDPLFKCSEYEDSYEERLILTDDGGIAVQRHYEGGEFEEVVYDYVALLIENGSVILLDPISLKPAYVASLSAIVDTLIESYQAAKNTYTKGLKGKPAYNLRLSYYIDHYYKASTLINQLIHLRDLEAAEMKYYHASKANINREIRTARRSLSSFDKKVENGGKVTKKDISRRDRNLERLAYLEAERSLINAPARTFL